MFFTPMGVIVLLVTLLAAIPGALATTTKGTTKASNKSKTKRAEVYAAIEDEPVIASDGVTEITVPKRTPSRFEVVPEDKRAQILKRMQLCQELFKETGKAYDYRTMTTLELEKELETVKIARSVQEPKLEPELEPAAELPVDAE